MKQPIHEQVEKEEVSHEGDDAPKRGLLWGWKILPVNHLLKFIAELSHGEKSSSNPTHLKAHFVRNPS